MKTFVYEFLYAVAWMMVGAALVGVAMADDRVTRIQTAWNSGDVAATQQDFDRAYPREMAELGSQVNGKMEVLNSVRLNEKAIAAKVKINGEPYVWTFSEKDGKLTSFHHKSLAEIGIFGGMEAGQAADVGTTLYALGQGFSEGNPLGLAGAGLIKATFLIGSRYSAFDDCVVQRAGFDMVGWGAAASNLLTLAGGPGFVAMPLVMWMRFDPAHETAAFECAAFALEA